MPVALGAGLGASGRRNPLIGMGQVRDLPPSILGSPSWSCDAIGLASRSQASGERNVPLEYFYTLYAFANLDRFAFEIEETLLPDRPSGTGRIQLDRSRVWRDDLIVEPGTAGRVTPH